MTEQKTDERFESWVILELLGHRRLAGYARQVELFGAAMCRLDVPFPDERAGFHFTCYHTASAIYGITPVTEDVARAVVRQEKPTPITYFEAQRLNQPKLGIVYTENEHEETF